MYPVSSQGCLLGPGMDVCALGAQLRARAEPGRRGWAAELLVSAGSPGKGKLTCVQSCLCLSGFRVRTTV